MLSESFMKDKIDIYFIYLVHTKFIHKIKTL
jgi:hypothetical protein